MRDIGEKTWINLNFTLPRIIYARYYGRKNAEKTETDFKYTIHLFLIIRSLQAR